jgi:prephenate dehydrogenase
LSERPSRVVGIVGTGLIGASVGLAARAAGFRTVGYDSERGSADRAAALGALDDVAATSEEAIAAADLVVVAVPPAAALEVLGAFPPAPRAQLVLDTASVKARVVAAAARVPNFVGSHPIAGNEGSGPGAARADLFAGRAWALIPPAGVALLARAHSFIEALGARPFDIDAERHDALVAFTSHLPQVVSTALGAALAERLDDRSLADLCGPGLRSMLRLAGSPYPLWSEILDANRQAVAQEVRAFAGILRCVADALDARNRDALASVFADAASAAAHLATNGAPASVISDDTKPRGIA